MNNSMHENAFCNPIICYKLGQDNAVSQADQEGIQLYRAALAGDYAKASERELLTFLRNAAAQQNEDGLLHLVNDDGTMPSDVKIGVWYEPSWAASAAGIYAYLRWPEAFDAAMQKFLAAILTASVRFGMAGHGYESYSEWSNNMLMFAKAGATIFLQQNPSLSPEFAACIQRGISDCQGRLREAAVRQTILYDGSFYPAPLEARERQILAAYEGKMQAVFVYGTLMRGQRAHSLLEDAMYGGRFVLKDYALYDLGTYPAIQKKEGYCAEGEVWFVAESQFAQLDSYEGEGSLYARQSVTVQSDRGTLAAQAYVYLPEVKSKPMRCGWGAADTDTVWYAGYGSNLSGERFACYIMGGVCKGNGKNYSGCRDKTPWTGVSNLCAEGELYFGNRSSSWNGKGVAFFDPNGSGQTQMRAYRITRGQLADIQKQEGKSANWYGRTVCLGIKDGCPIYTLTSETRQPENAPDEVYQQLLQNALVCNCGYKTREAQSYLKQHLPHEVRKKCAHGSEL